jgi:dihydropyrimidinase
VSPVSDFDLVVRNGTLVIPGIGTVAADVGICGSRIAAIGEELAGPAGDVLDARGKVVLPGIFDPHVHIGNELAFDQEAQTETRAAILGGVTIGIMVRSLEDSYFLHLPAFRRAMDEASYADSVFHLQIFTEQQIAEMPDYAQQYGVRSFKFYMSGIPGIVNSVTDDVLFEGFERVASIGADVVACVHCETGALISRARRDLVARKPEGTLADWEDAHPAVAEALAVRTAAYLAKRAAVHLYVVHVSSRDGLEAVRAARREGGRITAETITPFLGISSDDPIGFLAKMVPPVRTPEHRAALWEGIRDGTIDTVGTDNTSRMRASKRPEAGLHNSRPGHPSLGTHLATLLHHGRSQGIALPRRPTASFRAKARSRPAPMRISPSSISSSRKSCVPRTCAACRISRRSKARRSRAGRWPPSRPARSWRRTARSSVRRPAAIFPAPHPACTMNSIPQPLDRIIA